MRKQLNRPREKRELSAEEKSLRGRASKRLTKKLKKLRRYYAENPVIPKNFSRAKMLKVYIERERMEKRYKIPFNVTPIKKYKDGGKFVASNVLIVQRDLENTDPQLAAKRGKYRAIRRAGRQCIPEHFNFRATIPYYQHRDILTELCGFDWVVDHIHPLSAGGLHEASNLQVIPASVNNYKSVWGFDALCEELKRRGEELPDKRQTAALRMFMDDPWPNIPYTPQELRRMLNEQIEQQNKTFQEKGWSNIPMESELQGVRRARTA